MRFLVATARPILLDLSGTLAFYLVYLVTGSAQLGAAVGLFLGLAQLAHTIIKRRRPAGLLLVSVGLTAVLGGLTYLTHDPQFMLLKPSIICVVLGVTMLPKGWITAYVPPIARELLSERTFDRVGWAWSGLMFGSAILNLAAVTVLEPKLAALVFGVWAMASKVALFAGQYTFLRVRAGRIHRRRQAKGPLDSIAQSIEAA